MGTSELLEQESALVISMHPNGIRCSRSLTTPTFAVIWALQCVKSGCQLNSEAGPYSQM